MIKTLRKAGFDAADLPRSQAVEAPLDRSELAPTRAQDIMEHIVVLPCDPVMPDSELERQASIVKRTLAEEPKSP